MTARSFLKHMSLALVTLCCITALSETAKAQATDTTPPRIQSITRYDPLGQYTSETEVVWEITFTEDVTGADIVGDFTLGHNFPGSLSPLAFPLVEVSPSVYRARIRLTYPVTDGTRSMWIVPRSDGTIYDMAGNAMTDFSVVDVSEVYSPDNVGPTLSITSSSSMPTNSSVVQLTFTFSEIVTGFDASDLTLSSGTGSFSNFSGSGSTYTADLTLTSTGAFQVSVADAAAVDRANNPGTGATLSGTRDVTAPSAVLSAIPPEVNGPFDVTVTFDEDMTGFALGDFTVVNGTASNLQSISAQVYTATVTPDADGTVSVSLPAGATTDAAGNGNTASNTVSTTADVTRPTVSLDMPTGLVNAPFTLTMTFSEEVSAVTLGNISVSNGSASNLQQPSATVYTATITPDTDGVITVNFPENVVTDTAGLGNEAATAVTNTADLTAPTPTVSLTDNGPGNPYTATISFDEDVNDFTLGDITVTNGVASDLQTVSAREYSATVTPDADGTVTVSVPAGVATDAVGNDNIASNTETTTADITRPTVTLDMPSGLVNAPFTLTMTFSEEVTGVALGNISVSNGTVSNLQQTSTTVYTATITPDADGTVTVNFAENAVMDLSGLGNTAATAVTNTADLTDPTPTLTATPDFPGTPYMVTISFNEDVTGLDLGDFSTTNVDLSSLSGSGDSYTLQATGTDFAQSIQLRADTVLDTADNGNSASNIISVAPDGVAPSLTISGVPTTITRGESFVATFTFTESVVGFEASDISLTNATMGALTGSGSVYSVPITPDDRGDVTVSVADGAARDVTGELSVAATAFAQLDTSAEESEAIAHFLEARARSLIQNQPDVSRFVTGESAGNAAVSVSRGAGEFSLNSRGNGPLWMAVSGSWSDSDTEDMSYGLASIGYHTELSSGTLIGAMLQYDIAKQEDTAGTTVEGSGWLVGPYFATQIGDHPFYVDGRLLFGETDNDITLSTGQTGSFSGDRMLASLGAQGRVEMEQGWTLIPNLTVSHVSDAQDAYVSGNNIVPDQKVTLTELEAGLDFEVPIFVRQGDLMLDFGVSGVYGHTKGSGAASAYIAEEEGYRGRMDIGLSYDNGNGVRSSGSAFVDGLGGDTDVSSYGLSFEVAFTF
nr:Ig-like domain-containing protein [uncultured Celeribacter sp.]